MTRFHFETCGVCGRSTTAADYYARIHSRCKECHKKAVKMRRLTNPSVREYDRQRAKLPVRRAKSRAVTVKWRADNPLAYKAQTAVGNAVRDGKLKKEPCGVCGATEHVHAHHQDYSKPLDVRWLCARCHHRIHALFPELGGHYEVAA